MARKPKPTEGRAFDSEAALILYLAEVVKRRGFTHQYIADKTGLSRPQVTKVLNGSVSPTLFTFFKVADALGVAARFSAQIENLPEFAVVPTGWEMPEMEEIEDATEGENL